MVPTKCMIVTSTSQPDVNKSTGEIHMGLASAMKEKKALDDAMGYETFHIHECMIMSKEEFHDLCPGWKSEESRYMMRIETDHDFSVLFNGSLFSGCPETIWLKSLDELRLIVPMGPWGSLPSKSTKLWEFNEAMEAIKKDPESEFDNTGGNRGVVWIPLKGKSL